MLFYYANDIGELTYVLLHPRDIAELTQYVNQLEGELNHFSEENEALRDKHGLKMGDVVDTSGVRARHVSELDKLRKENRVLENEVSFWGNQLIIWGSEGTQSGGHPTYPRILSISDWRSKGTQSDIPV